MPAENSSNQIRLTRVYDAPVRAVWEAWTDPEQIAKWWGPRGFTLTTHSKELRPGGTWRYTMHGPDGVDYPNIATYHVVEPRKTLVYDHGATDDTPPLFHVTVTFSEEAGKTTLELAFTLASPEAAAEMARHIKRAGGNATWDRLAEHLDEATTGRRRFVINRTLPAPIARVFGMWSDPDQRTQWLPAAQGRAEILTIDAPRRIVYRHAAAPGTDVGPATLLTTVLFVEEAADRTRMTVTCEPDTEATRSETDAFARERSGMTGAWTSSFDALESLVGSPSAEVSVTP